MGITQFLIKEGITHLERVTDANGKLSNIYIRVGAIFVITERGLNMEQVDRNKVLSHGKEIVGKLLVDLQVRKSTADGAGANEFYTALTTPMQGWIPEMRDVVISKKLVCR